MAPAVSTDNRSQTPLQPERRLLESNPRGVHRRVDRYTRDLPLRSEQACPWEIGSSQVAKLRHDPVGVCLSVLLRRSHPRTPASRSLHPRFNSLIPEVLSLCRSEVGLAGQFKFRIHGGAVLQRRHNLNGISASLLAPRHGFEPRFTAPKAAVLPLDDRGKSSEACPLSVTQPSLNLKNLAGTSRSRIDQRPKDVQQF